MDTALLPELHEGPYTPNVQHAINIIQTTFRHAVRTLEQEDSDSIQLRVLAEQIKGTVIPLLSALEAEPIPHHWIRTVAERFATVLQDLEAAGSAMDGM